MNKKKNPLIDFSKIEGLQTDHDLKLVSKAYLGEFVPIMQVLNQEIPMKTELTNYLILRIITHVENTIKKLVADLIDNFDANTDGLFQTPEVSISLSKLDSLKQNITKGRIVSTNFNFQDPKIIQFVLSNLLGVNFFETLKKAIAEGVPPFNDPKFSGDGKKLLENWDFLLSVFEKRNMIAHSIITKINYDKDEFGKAFNHVFAFLAGTIVLGRHTARFRINLPESKEFCAFIHTMTKQYKSETL